MCRAYRQNNMRQSPLAGLLLAAAAVVVALLVPGTLAAAVTPQTVFDINKPLWGSAYEVRPHFIHIWRHPPVLSASELIALLSVHASRIS